ncbi:pilin [Patescibacteria group bacterium]|nr:pilin [Patescibacteria group bacterium]
MIQKITDKIKYAALFAPVYAQNPNIIIKPENSSPFIDLTKLEIGGMISGAISLIMLLVALIFFFMLIWGGLRWVTSQGEEKAVAAARAQITNSLIGLAIVFSAFAIVKLIGIVFGVDILDTLTIPTFN